MEKKHNAISLIPGGCPQFLDFEICISTLPRIARHFKEEKKVQNTATESKYEHFLRCIVEEDGQDIDQITRQVCDRDYTFDTRRILDTWLDRWIPLPFLRTRGQKWDDTGERFEYGPSNWVRARMTKKDADTLTLTLIFDTNVEELPTHSIRHESLDGNEDFSGEQYYALSPRDVAAHGVFALAHHVRDNAWFLNAPWVDTWLLNTYTAHELKKTKGRPPRHDEEYVLKHLASYLTWLEVVREALSHTTVQVINPDRDQPVEVDLILDIGNSRTTGILVETLPQRITNLNDSYLLELRDLSEPQHLYSDPFETRVEFVEADFGDDALSRRSGRRTPAFAWPSAVRVGPEAARLATHAVCAEGSSGMSSPKRYLWDERPWQQTWRYNSSGPQESMVTRGLFPRQVNREGTPLCCYDEAVSKNPQVFKPQKKELAFESLFTRSSLMLFMVGEIITQALVTINSPATRSRRELPNLPRRLRRILFTVPTAMPVAEKRIFKRWVTWAVRVVWEALGWSEWHMLKEKDARNSKDYRTSPQVRCDWDEASCSQIVYIYNELSVKYHGDAHNLFNLLGKPREAYGNKPCVRIASIDTGGGTMDLSIATYELASGVGDTARISPHMEFRDGFNIAGDEVLRDMVAQHIIPCLSDAFSKAGIIEPRTIIGQLFGRDAIGISQDQRNLRARFVRQVAVPVALGMLGICELLYQNTTEIQENHPPFTCKFGDFFTQIEQSEQAEQSEEVQDGEEKAAPFSHLENIHLSPTFFYPMPQAHIISAVEQSIQAHLPSGTEFSLMDVELCINPTAVENTIRATLGPALAALCEVVHLHDCDVLLLTGRPSAWNGIVAPVLAKLPVPMHRIIPMRQYHVGNWYPFADVHGRITDPKTTVVVGAILCALAEGHLEGFSFDVGNLQLSSTARYVGEMDINGQLRRPKVWFEVDVNNKKEFNETRVVQFASPIPIGYRQLDAERWPTTRYNLLTFSSKAAQDRAAGCLPYEVTVRLVVSEIIWDEKVDRDEGEYLIESITNKHGDFVSETDLCIRLQTLPLDEGYWLDTGIISNA